MKTEFNYRFEVLFDEQDRELLSKYEWFVSLRRTGAAYVLAADGANTVCMHRLLMGAQKGQIVDHINGNGLDNRRSNLRFATSAQNNRNRKLQRNNTSGYRGVSYQARDCVWHAKIQVDGKDIHLGTFKSPEAAAVAYKAAAAHYHKEFVRDDSIPFYPRLRRSDKTSSLAEARLLSGAP